MSSDDNRPSKRARQACDPCRRKKSRCPGERPVCSYCERLGQPCVYSQNELGEGMPVDMARRLSQVEGRLEELINSLGSRQALTPVTVHADAHSGEEAIQNDTPPSDMFSVAQLYINCCHHQPLPLFSADRFVETISTRDPELLLALQAVCLRFQDESMDNQTPRIQECARQSRALVMERVSHGTLELSTLQTLCLLAVYEFTAGQITQAGLTINMAAYLAHSINLTGETLGDIHNDPNEKRRCLWSIYLLQALQGDGIQTTRLMSGVRTPFNTGSGLSPTCTPPSIPDASISGTNAKEDLGLVAYTIQLSEIWSLTMSYAASRVDPSSPPPWSPLADYSTITYRHMEFDSRVPLKYRYHANSFRDHSLDDLNHRRDFWAPYLFVQFMWLAIPCVLNHPFLLSMRLRSFRHTMPQAFIRQSFENITVHTNWMLHMIDLIEHKGFDVCDPVLAHCVVVVATIHLQHSFVDDPAFREKARSGYSKCLRFLTRLEKRWAHVKNMIERLHHLHESVSTSTDRQSWATSARLLWELLIYDHASKPPSLPEGLFGLSLSDPQSGNPVEERVMTPDPDFPLVGSAGISGHKTVAKEVVMYPPESVSTPDMNRHGSQTPSIPSRLHSRMDMRLAGGDGSRKADVRRRRIGAHNVVIASLPSGAYGNTSATSVGIQLLSSFDAVRIGFMVGIGGGVPSSHADIRLGDIVVSQPSDTFGGVIQYDLGKVLSNGHFRQTGMLNRPPNVLLTALATLQAHHFTEDSRVGGFVSDIQAKIAPHRARMFARPVQEDCLFRADYDHVASETCVHCDRSKLVPRSPRERQQPVIHYGLIGSANQVVKDGRRRDQLARDLGELLLIVPVDHQVHGIPATLRDPLADDADGERYWIVPFGRNKDFVGREEALTQLLGIIAPRAEPDDCQRTAIEGLGGVGKTQIALEAAFRMRETSPDCAVFWLAAVDAATFENSCREICRQLNIARSDDQKADVKSLVKTSLSQSKYTWLLIVDNADDTELLFGTTPLCDYLPFSTRGSILFTTRTHELVVELDIPPSSIVTLSEMRRPEAIELLHKNLTAHQRKSADHATTASLLDFLADLPLAIRQASAYMAKTGIAVTEYFQYCRSSDEALIKLLSKDFGDRTRYKNVQNPVATTWWISFRHISRDSALAARYVKFMSFLAERDIPKDLLPEGNALDVYEAVGTLKAYAFITEREGQESYDMHRLVRLAMRNWLAQDGGELVACVTAVMRRLDEMFPLPEHRNRQVWVRYLPHILTTLEFRGYSTDNAVKSDLLSNVGTGSYMLGKYHDAEGFHRQTLELRGEMLGAEHPDTLGSMNSLSDALWGQGKYDEAESMYQRTLALRTKVLGADHPDTLTSMNNLSNALWSQGKYKEASAMYESTLELRKRVLGVEHPDTLTSMSDLSDTLWGLGKYKEAESMYRQVLTLRTKALGADHPDTLTSMNNLANDLWSQGKYSDAEALHSATLQQRTKVLGPEHPDTLRSMNNLAVVAENLKKYSEAEAMHRGALELQTKVLGEAHLETTRSMNNVAALLLSLEKYGEAESILRRAGELQTKALGAEHPETLRSMDNLGRALHGQGMYEEAELNYRQTLDHLIKVHGMEHPHTLRTMHHLALVLDSQRRYEEAESMYRQTVELRTKVLGSTHPFTLESLKNLASVLKSRGKRED
ncbi:hypothetical protein FE257_003784 [Aspergillus nanangensis]|uniref:Zn(2)-C6 fungal-type domain-containing protein n=1 Tax=Aspergillus nanangensis TaxID=2582783 RepID=A0AAD4CCG3_ASPNN|nr:hypothetical protein FE257_003784 [Aspergillus nanangensis]